jgi:hypothetical protein
MSRRQILLMPTWHVVATRETTCNDARRVVAFKGAKLIRKTLCAEERKDADARADGHPAGRWHPRQGRCEARQRAICSGELLLCAPSRTNQRWRASQGTWGRQLGRGSARPPGCAPGSVPLPDGSTPDGLAGLRPEPAPGGGLPLDRRCPVFAAGGPHCPSSRPPASFETPPQRKS